MYTNMDTIMFVRGPSALTCDSSVSLRECPGRTSVHYSPTSPFVLFSIGASGLTPIERSTPG